MPLMSARLVRGRTEQVDTFLAADTCLREFGRKVLVMGAVIFKPAFSVSSSLVSSVMLRTSDFHAMRWAAVRDTADTGEKGCPLSPKSSATYMAKGSF